MDGAAQGEGNGTGAPWVVRKKYKSFANLLVYPLVNKSFVKFVTDFGPLIVFFFFYYNSDKNLIVAIPPFIIATLIAFASFALSAVFSDEDCNSLFFLLVRGLRGFFCSSSDIIIIMVIG